MDVTDFGNSYDTVQTSRLRQRFGVFLLCGVEAKDIDVTGIQAADPSTAGPNCNAHPLTT